MAFAIAPERPAATRRRDRRGRDGRARPLPRERRLVLRVCHTDRGDDGALVGPPFGGGQRMDVAADTTKVYVSPNLTPDRDTSPVGQWDEATFVARFRTGELVHGTPMPWGAFARITGDDLRAV